MTEDLKTLVAWTIDATIRSFSPGDGQSYVRWDSELESLERSLLEATSEQDRQDLLASVRAQRISLAFDAGKIESVLEQSTGFLRDTSPHHPSFFFVVTLRARSFHQSGLHDEELREVLAVARKPEVHGSEFVFLLENLARRHPGSIPSDEQLSGKMRDAISALRAQEYDTLPAAPDDEMQVEHMALSIAAELRRVHRQKAEALLSGRSS